MFDWKSNVLVRIPSILRCATDRSHIPSHTSYVAVTMWLLQAVAGARLDCERTPELFAAQGQTPRPPSIVRRPLQLG